MLESDWISDGTLVNAMGSNIANRRELPGDLMKRAGLVAVDSLEQAKIEAGDLTVQAQYRLHLFQARDHL